MKCTLSRELLALYVEGDLSAPQAEKVKRHLVECTECQEFVQRLERSQSSIKSLRQETVSPEAIAKVRRDVLSRIDNPENILRWPVRVERLVLLGLRGHRYAVAGLGVLAIVSASLLLGQIRVFQGEAEGPAAVFEGKTTLLRPDRYREWVFVGSSIGLSYSDNVAATGSQSPKFFENVYINPAAYRKYAETGKFPEGTVMILELARSEEKNEPRLQGMYEKEFVALEASVKDSSRFEGGWGFFGFTDNQGKPKAKAEALPEQSGCRSCHLERAETDHVFTQFYPVLKSVRS
jgi:predicted anti-sigma-YlaC factor YlaD